MLFVVVVVVVVVVAVAPILPSPASTSDTVTSSQNSVQPSHLRRERKIKRRCDRR